MLEQLRRNSRSFLIWVLFGIIIAAFVLTFGTQEVSPGCASGSVGSDVMMVDGQKVTVHSWRFGMNTTQAGANKLFRSQQVLDRLLERELLAQEAERSGYRVSTDLASQQIAEGRFYVLGSPGDGKQFYYRNGVFDYDTLQARVNGWGLPSVDEFIKQQQRELLAQSMRQLILESAVVSPEEVRTRFVQENTRATLDVIQLRPSEYRSLLNLSDTEIAAYLAANEAEVRKRYEDNERAYQGVGKQVKVRQIMFRPKRQAGDEADVDPGEAAARAAHARLAAGADFDAVARELSEDERSQVKGGDLGWRSVEAPGLGARELADALQTLQVGDLSDVITTPRGYYILKVEGEREGDLSFDDVKLELAGIMAPEQYARRAAERDARAALDRARTALAEGKRLDEVFERQAAPPPRPGPGMDSLPADMSPEELQQLLQQLQQQGSVIVESRNMPAQADLQAGATGDDAAGATGDDAAGATADTGPIPVPEGLVAPRLRQVGPFMRDAEGTVGQVGRSPELMKAAFDQLEPGQLADQVFQVGDSFVIAQLVSREQADLDELEKNMQKEMSQLALERGYRLYGEWLKERCSTLLKGDDIGINRNLMSQLADSEEQKFSYRPFCAE